jgi:Glyoxalase-like domain
VAVLNNITFACENPVELSEFWEAVLGYVRPTFPPEFEAKIQEQIDAGELDPTGWAMLLHPDGVGPRLLFQRRAKTPTESIPIHLDLGSSDPQAELERLLSLGATQVETKSHTIAGFTETWTVLRDPEGNAFCLNHGSRD